MLAISEFAINAQCTHTHQAWASRFFLSLNCNKKKVDSKKKTLVNFWIAQKLYQHRIENWLKIVPMSRCSDRWTTGWAQVLLKFQELKYCSFLRIYTNKCNAVKCIPEFNDNTNVRFICCPFTTNGHLENEIKMHESVRFVFIDGRFRCTHAIWFYLDFAILFLMIKENKE